MSTFFIVEANETYSEVASTECVRRTRIRDYRSQRYTLWASGTYTKIWTCHCPTVSQFLGEVRSDLLQIQVLFPTLTPALQRLWLEAVLKICSQTLLGFLTSYVERFIIVKCVPSKLYKLYCSRDVSHFSRNRLAAGTVVWRPVVLSRVALMPFAFVPFKL